MPSGRPRRSVRPSARSDVAESTTSCQAKEPRKRAGRPTEQADSAPLAAAISAPGDEPYRALARCGMSGVLVALEVRDTQHRGTSATAGLGAPLGFAVTVRLPMGAAPGLAPPPAGAVPQRDHHGTGASNGPTEGLNLCVKKVKRCGHGFRSSSTTGCGCTPRRWRHLAEAASTTRRPNRCFPLRRVEPEPVTWPFRAPERPPS